MRVVLFCGGLGMRLRKDGENVPKPLVTVGDRPILWHLMQYYAHYGHREFILCLGYRAEALTEYFVSGAGRTPDWNVTFVDTGVMANVGERLAAIQPYVAGEQLFLANYADGLTDLHLPDVIDFARSHDRIACLVSVRPSLSYHLVATRADGVVSEIHEMSHSDVRINGGFYVFRQEIFDYLRDGEELVQEPFQRLIRDRQLVAYSHGGFFASMDTFKDKQMLDDLCAGGRAPWQVWKTLGAGVGT